MSYNWEMPFTVDMDDWGKPVVLGIDIGAEQVKMNGLQPVTVDIARTLARYGTIYIQSAIAAAKKPWYTSDLPGGTSRQNVLDHINWHVANIAKYPMSADSSAYPDANDLKKWVMQAYIESNAVDEGNATINQNWDEMWQEIGSKVAGYVSSAASAITSAATSTGKGIAQGAGFDINWTRWIVLGGLAVGGYMLYRSGTHPLRWVKNKLDGLGGK